MSVVVKVKVREDVLSTVRVVPPQVRPRLRDIYTYFEIYQHRFRWFQVSHLLYLLVDRLGECSWWVGVGECVCV